MFPHVYGKCADIGTLTLKAATVGFFAKAGMTPGKFCIYLAAAAELVAGVFLVLGLCTRYAALGAATSGLQGAARAPANSDPGSLRRPT